MFPFGSNKEKVHIISGNTVIKKKRCPTKEGKIIIEKPHKGRGNIGWVVSYTEKDFKYWRNILGILQRRLEIKDGAQSFIPFGKEPKAIDVPSCTRSDVEHYGNAKVIEKSGITKPEMSAPIILYLLVGGVLVLELINFLMAQGMVRP